MTAEVPVATLPGTPQVRTLCIGVCVRACTHCVWATVPCVFRQTRGSYFVTGAELFHRGGETDQSCKAAFLQRLGPEGS